MVYREADDPGQGLALFAWFVAGGLTYSGLLPCRDTDQFGFGVTTAFLGHDATKAARTARMAPAAHETALEWTDQLALTPWFYIQPDIQYVINPGADRAIPNGLAIGTRFSMRF